jgi:hypothetical protein
MKKKVYICKCIENKSGYFVYDDSYYLSDDDIWFDSYPIIWGDFTRCFYDEIDGMTFEELEHKFLEFEKDWVNMEPNFGLTNERDESLHLL